MRELWKAVVGWPGYMVSDRGRVKSFKRDPNGIFLKLTPDDNGYLLVSLHNQGERKQGAVNRMVLEAFVGPAPDGMMSCHWDGRPENNALSNLRWGTAKDNAEDDIRNGVRPRGEAHGRAKLLECDVREIRRRAHAGEKSKHLALEFGISQQLASRIVRRGVWRHI